MHKTTDLTGAKGTRVWRMLLTLLSATMLWVGGYGSTFLHAAQPVTIDPRRSLVVTEAAILARFPFARVMEQLVDQSGVAGLTSLELFHQWWDTQNPGPSLGLGPHCDDEVNGDGDPSLNDFPYTCRPAPSEGGQIHSDPFDDPDTNPDAYIPIGLFNRFDLAPSGGFHCGEYRIVYAKRSGIENSRERNLLIFEATQPNPHPNQGLEGCRKIVEFWADLSKETEVEKRADDLERFYFDGLGNVEPVVHVRHYGDNPKQEGQVRTNQFIQAPSSAWSLREFQLTRTCHGGSCRMQFIPVTDKVNPFGELHNADRDDSTATGYRDHFLTQIQVNKDEADEPLKGLAAITLNNIQFNVPNNTYNTGQSQASGSDENKYDFHFESATDTSFKNAIQAELDDIASDLPPAQIILRAEAQSCAGCHRLLNNVALGGGLTWPPSLGFTHVTERDAEVVDGQERFKISPALLNVFLPQRQQIMEDYLNNKLKKPKKPKDTLSGRKTH
jgi:hypothetical protein